MLIYLLYTVHFIVCAILILVVLLQTGKGADLASAFGGAGTQTVFGSRGAATVLSKMTIWSAILFLVTSLTLSIVQKRGPETIMDDVTEEEMMKEEIPQPPALPEGGVATEPESSTTGEPSEETGSPEGGAPGSTAPTSGGGAEEKPASE